MSLVSTESSLMIITAAHERFVFKSPQCPRVVSKLKIVFISLSSFQWGRNRIIDCNCHLFTLIINISNEWTWLIGQQDHSGTVGAKFMKIIHDVCVTDQQRILVINTQTFSQPLIQIFLKTSIRNIVWQMMLIPELKACWVSSLVWCHKIDTKLSDIIN